MASALDRLNSVEGGDDPLSRLSRAERIRPSSMAKPPSIGQAAIELKDSMMEGIKHRFGTYKRGIQNAGMMAAEPLLPDLFEKDSRANLAQEQAAADARFAPYKEAHPIASQAPGFIAEMLPATRTLKGAALVGGLQEGLKFDATDQLSNAAFGAAGGLGGQALGDKITKGFKRDPRAQRLVDEGVEDLTIGQQLGPFAKRLEDLGASIPGLGHTIAGAQDRSAMGFSRNRINNALKQMDELAVIPKGSEVFGPSGSKELSTELASKELSTITTPGGRNMGGKGKMERLPDSVASGDDAMLWADRKISDQYNSVLDKMSVKVDDQVLTDYTKVMELSKSLDPKAKKHLDTMLQRHVHTYLDNPSKTMLGESYRKANTGMREEAKRMINSGDPTMIDAGNALEEVRNVFRGATLRQNPDVADAFLGVERAFAKMRVNQDAANMRGAKDRIFNATQYAGAVKKNTDPRAFSHGTGFDNKLASDAEAVMSQKVNNSGTTDRALFTGGLLSGAILDPAATMGVGAGMAAYSKPGQDALTKIMFERSHPMWKELAKMQAIERAGRVAGAEYGAERNPL